MTQRHTRSRCINDVCVLIDESTQSCYSHTMTNSNWKDTWEDVELSEDELDNIEWSRFAMEMTGGKISRDDAIAIRKKLLASGYQKKYIDFLQTYRDQHGNLPTAEELDKWHAENPVERAISF